MRNKAWAWWTKLQEIVDAAVAVSAALNVTEPSCCGVGVSPAVLFHSWAYQSLFVGRRFLPIL